MSVAERLLATQVQRNAAAVASKCQLTPESHLTGPGTEPRTSTANNDDFNHYANRRQLAETDFVLEPRVFERDNSTIISLGWGSYESEFYESRKQIQDKAVRSNLSLSQI